MEHQSFKENPSNHPNSQNQLIGDNETVKQQAPATKIYKLRGPPKGSKRRPNLAVGIKSGLWTVNQMKGYLKFITRFVKHFQDKATRKKKKIFHRMSNFIKSRTAQQCRSHHQKLELKFVQHEKIINFIKTEITLKIQQSNAQAQVSQDDQDFEALVQNGLKIENQENFIKETQKQKKTDLKEASEYYEFNEARQGLTIMIYQQHMETW